jgi:hypothetical protein
MKTVNRRFQVVLLMAFFWLLFTHGPAEAQTAKRLMLKDGSYQLASKWEVSGDRVRYLSTERNEWEEVPASMVDWPATENFEKQRESQRKLELKQAEEEEESEKVAASPAIAPGLHLPNSGGVYLLDTYNGELQLTELGQSSGELNRRTGHNILRGAIAPITSSRQSIELKGEHARTQSHVQQPAIFLDIDQDPGTKSLPLAERFRIARLEPKKDARVVEIVKIAITGKVSQQEFLLPATVEQLQGGWVRLTPSQPLSPGEYAVVEMLAPKTMNAYVWDFGVNPSSPENPGVWKAAPKPSLSTETETPSDLQSRPR